MAGLAPNLLCILVQIVNEKNRACFKVKMIWCQWSCFWIIMPFLKVFLESVALPLKRFTWPKLAVWKTGKDEIFGWSLSVQVQLRISLKKRSSIIQNGDLSAGCETFFHLLEEDRIEKIVIAFKTFHFSKSSEIEKMDETKCLIKTFKKAWNFLTRAWRNKCKKFQIAFDLSLFQNESRTGEKKSFRNDTGQQRK